jgi:hypothetical protein
MTRCFDRRIMGNFDFCRVVAALSLAAALLSPMVSAAEAIEPANQRLFHIERNKNANIVVYDARVMPDSSLAEKDPMVVYWIKEAEDNRIEDLKGIERKMAYGFSVESREGDRLVIDLVADVGRDLVVDRHAGGYRAFIEIDGRRVLLDRIYIFAKETLMLPKVKYIELFGTDPDTGEEAYEKFKP